MHTNPVGACQPSLSTNSKAQNSVWVQPEYSVAVPNELMIWKAFTKRYTLVLIEEYDLHFFDILQFQKPFANASPPEFYF